MKTIKVLFSVGLALCLVIFGGLVATSAGAHTANGKAAHKVGHTPVNVCHATSSDTNPFVFITVDASSTRLQGHLQHRNDPNKAWKTDGVFLGQPVKAGDPKPDRIGTYTYQGKTYPLDGVITSKSDCGTLLPPPVAAPTGSFTQQCTATGATVTIGTLDPGTQVGVLWTFAYGDSSKQVATGDTVAATTGDSLKLAWTASDESHGVVQEGTAIAACPTPPVPPTGSLVVPTCTAMGALVDVGTLSQGTSTGGSFQLIVAGVPQTVTSGQQDIVVPAGASLVLTYVPATGPSVTLATATAPAACPPPVTPPEGTRDLTVTKRVVPTGTAAFGDTLTYTLTVKALGTLPQTGVTVTDQIPTGTSYVTGSATCPGGCASVTVAKETVTWVLGGMAAGTTRHVTFAVTIDTPAAAANGGIPAVTITNVGAVGSAELGAHDSNKVVTDVTAVEAVKVENPTATEPAAETLPPTGADGPIGAATGLGLLLLTVGAALVSAPRLARAMGRPR